MMDFADTAEAAATLNDSNAKWQPLKKVKGGRKGTYTPGNIKK